EKEAPEEGWQWQEISAIRDRDEASGQVREEYTLMEASVTERADKPDNRHSGTQMPSVIYSSQSSRRSFDVDRDWDPPMALPSPQPSPSPPLVSNLPPLPPGHRAS